MSDDSGKDLLSLLALVIFLTFAIILYNTWIDNPMLDIEKSGQIRALCKYHNGTLDYYDFNTNAIYCKNIRNPPEFKGNSLMLSGIEIGVKGRYE